MQQSILVQTVVQSRYAKAPVLKTVAAALLALTTALTIGVPQGYAQGASGAAPGHASPTPSGFEHYLVYMGESTVAPGEASTLTDGASVEQYQHEVMKRSPAEVADVKAQAEQFFLQRFGLDFTSSEPDANGLEMIPGAMLMAFVQNPKANYRAYTISGMAVPAEGWRVRDGGWMAVLTEEMVLGGDYGGPEGKTVPAGAAFVFGNYNILVKKPNSQSPAHSEDAIVIHYESGHPIVTNADGVMTFQCALSHPEWGLGRARGVVEGKIIRNVLTFPAELP